MKRKIIIVLIIFITIIYLFSRIAKPLIITKARNDSNNIITKIINQSVNEIIAEIPSSEDFFIMTYDNNGSIVSLDYDSVVLNRIITNISLKIEESIRYLADNTYKIPFGIIFKNSFLSQVGPNIPVKLKLDGSVINEIKTKVTNYGINNALIEIYVDITVNIDLLLPFVSTTSSINSLIPLTIKLIRGNVPEYYAGGNQDNLISIPIQ